MKGLLFYLLQVIICSGILYGYYFIALRNLKFHQYNRFYLLATVVISIVIPFLNIPVYFDTEEKGSSLIFRTLSVISTDNISQSLVIPASVGETHTPVSFPWERILQAFYFLIVFLILTRLLIAFKRIHTLLDKYIVERVDHIYFINTEEPGTPFSFFKWLFWNKKIDLQSEKGQQIFRHELYHIDHRHSRDIVFMELLIVFFWINPFFLLIKREIKTIHEFLADRFAIKENNEWEYAEVLLMHVLGTPNTHLVNPFFQNQVRRRIAMITSSKKPGYQYLRKLMVLPVAAIILGLFAFNYNANRKTENLIVIEGNVKQIPDGKVYLTEAHQWSIFLDSAIVKNGRFSFKIKAGSDFAPFMASIAFPDNNEWSGIGQLMFANEFVLPPATSKFRYYHSTGFYLEKGRTEITDSNYEATPKLPAGATIIPVKIKAGIETELMYKNIFTPIGSPGGNSAEHITKINSLRKIVAQYPFSYYLLQSIIEERGSFSAKELQEFFSLFNQDLQVSKPGIQLSTYIKTGTKPAEQVHGITDTIKWVQDYDLITQPVSSIPVLKSDTLKPHSKNSFFVNHKEKIVLEADSLIFIPNATKLNIPDFDKVVVFVNGRKEKNDLLRKKTIISERIVFYSANADAATRQYGSEARDGVIAFEGAQVVNIPQHIFYEEDYAAIAKRKEQDNKVFVKMDIEPRFPGGENEWKRYLKTSLNSEIPSRKGAPPGTYTVFIQFIVDKEGNLSEIKPLTKHGFGMEDEAIRVITNSQKWIPGIQNGRSVKGYRRQPITFIVARAKGISGLPGKDPATMDYSNPSNWDRNDTAFMNWRRQAINEIKAKARIEGKAAYFYKGRTYVFVRIDESKPANTDSFFESDGLVKLFALNGKLIHSIEEINICYQRKDIKSMKFAFREEAKKKYDIPDTILEIETF